MRSRVIAMAAGIALACVLNPARAQTPAAPPAAPSGAAAQPAAASAGLPAHVIGSWRSAPDRTQLTGEFEESVWGRNATAERQVALRVEKSGEATLTVSSRILDAKGRAVRGPTSIEESRLRIGGPLQTTPAGTDLAVTVVSAERRYPDDPAGTWPLDGLKVRLITRDDPGRLELRYDTPEGRGSFWETLTRDGKPSPPRQASRTSTGP